MIIAIAPCAARYNVLFTCQHFGVDIWMSFFVTTAVCWAGHICGCSGINIALAGMNRLLLLPVQRQEASIWTT